MMIHRTTLHRSLINMIHDIYIYTRVYGSTGTSSTDETTVHLVLWLVVLVESRMFRTYRLPVTGTATGVK